MTKVDTVVVGGGAMGLATAWQIARRGREVTLLEMFEPGHHHGASHGVTRNFNTGYSNPTYADLVQEARTSWQELESETGSTLLDLVGLVNHGVYAGFDDVHYALTSRGSAARFLPRGEAAERWPGMRFEDRVLFIPGGGRIRASDALQALHTSAVDHGAQIRHRTPVTGIDVVGEDLVQVSTSEETFQARRVVVTAGAWTSKLLSPLLPLPPLTVTQEQPAHFRPSDPTTPWPSFNHYPRPDPADDYWYSAVYGMLTPGEGVKAGWHGVGPITDPDARSFQPEPVQLAALQRYAREWLPGVDSEDLQPISCTYTTTTTEDFILDRRGPVVVGAGFSGHGFKFTPAVGRVLADLVEGHPAPRLFAMS